MPTLFSNINQDEEESGGTLFAGVNAAAEKPTWYEQLIYNVANPAMRGIMMLNAPSVYGVETIAAMQRTKEGLAGMRPRQLYLPEYSTWEQATRGEYVNPEDPATQLRALAGSPFPGGISPGILIERAIRGPETAENQFLSTGRATLPDTYEQAYEILKGVTDALSWESTAPALDLDENGNVVLGPTEAHRVGMPQWMAAVGAGLWNERTVAEITSDPFILFEAFNVGRKVLDAATLGIDALNRPAGAFRRSMEVLEGVPGADLTRSQRSARFMSNRILSPTAEFSHQVTGLAWRRVYRGARFPQAAGEHQIAREAEQQFGRQTELQQVLGQTGPEFEEITMPHITRMGEAVPKAIREPFEQMGEMAAGTRTGEIPPGGIRTPGGEVRTGTPEFEIMRTDLADMVGREFGDIPTDAQDLIADTLIDNWSASGLYPEASRIMDLPGENLVGDIGYMMRVTTKEARQARWQSMTPEMRKLYRWNMDNMPADNMLGQTLTDEAKRRNLRGLVSYYNDMGPRGRVGYVDGQIKLLSEGAVAPEGFIPVRKLLTDNPFQLATARFARHARGHSAATFLKEATVNPVLLARQGIEEGFTLETLVKRARGWGEGEYNRTFEQLGPGLKSLVEETKWRDLDTAFGVASYLRVLQDMNFRPHPTLAVLDRITSMWRGLTLTPFMSYHNRNMIGEANNHLMSRGKKGEPIGDVFDLVDALYPTANRRRLGSGDVPGHFEEFLKIGADQTGMVRQEWSAVQDAARVRPLDGTPLESKWSMNPFSENFGGRHIAMAVDRTGRFATFLGARRRGYDVKDAAELMFKYHYDYADIPPWFQHGTWARRAASFPIWTMKNIPLQMEHLITTPTWFAMRGRVINQMMASSPGDPAPDWAVEAGAVQAPDGTWIIPQNFDPAYSPAELLNPAEFIWNLFNPFISEPLQQTGAAVLPELMPGGEPPTDVSIHDIAQRGYDPFRHRTIESPYREWHEMIGGGKMPAWAQRGDHFLRQFLRPYNEMSQTIRESARIGAGESPYETEEYLGRRALGLPGFKFNPLQTVYYGIKDVDDELDEMRGLINANDGVATPDQLAALKNLYGRKVGYLAHGTFMEVDPWTGDPRPWLDTAQEDEFTIRGRQKLYRDLLNTMNLLVYGRRGYGTQQLHEPIPLDETELEAIQELMTTTIDSYVAMMYGSDFGEERINYPAEGAWLESRTPEVMEISTMLEEAYGE